MAAEEKDRVQLLEALSNEAELDIRKYSKTEQQLHLKIQALYEAEVDQLQRIEEAKARLRAQEGVLQARVNEVEHVPEVAAIEFEAEPISVTPEPEVVEVKEDPANSKSTRKLRRFAR